MRPAQLQDNYTNLLDRQVSERIGTIPPVLLDDLKRMDSKVDYQPHQLSAEERTVFEDSLGQLPAFLLQALQAEVFDIYFVDNFSGGGMTYCIWKDGKPKYVLLFNPETLHKSLSDWLSYRDNSAFDSLNSVLSLRETESGRHIGFLHTLVHESCHVYDFAHSVTETPDRKLTAVSSKTWKDHKTVLPEFDFPIRLRLSFYDFEAKPKIPLSILATDFEKFSRTGLASIYGSMNSMDDFAENVTYVLLDQLYGAKLSLQLLQDGKVLKSFEPSLSPQVLRRNAQFMGN